VQSAANPSVIVKVCVTGSDVAPQSQLILMKLMIYYSTRSRSPEIGLQAVRTFKNKEDERGGLFGFFSVLESTSFTDGL